MHDGPTAFRLELAGNLNHEATQRLDQDWRTASSTIGDRRLVVDLTLVTGADEQGRDLLTRWTTEGAQLIATSAASRALAESIVGGPLLEPPVAATTDRAWLRFRASILGRTAALPWLVMLALPVEMSAATLKSETVAAWDDYLQTVNGNLQDRARGGGSFLWTLADAERAAKIRGGEIVVVPAPGQNPKKVPGGLIHHWMGAMFLPNLRLEDILDVTRDYDRYKEFYRPFVMESKAIARGNSSDIFSMLLMNKVFLSKTALDADYEVTNVRLDDHRFYSISKTTRVQEIEEYGQPGEYWKPQGQGGGYIWKLYSIARLEQRDGGVYLEIEAVGLSRDIPVAVRFVVDPIVRRVSRNSLLISLQQTKEAVDGRLAEVTKSPEVPASAQRIPSVSTTLSNKSSAFTSVH
jgi:hypothetical protein